MPNKLVSLRVREELWAAVGAYAKERGSTRTAVVDAALRGLLEDVKGGVPDLGPAVGAPRVKSAPTWHAHAAVRQAKLNEAKYGRKR